MTEGSSLDIVRELSFIATDREGSQWRAEVRYRRIPTYYAYFSLFFLGVSLYSFLEVKGRL